MKGGEGSRLSPPFFAPFNPPLLYAVEGLAEMRSLHRRITNAHMSLGYYFSPKNHVVIASHVCYNTMLPRVCIHLDVRK